MSYFRLRLQLVFPVSLQQSSTPHQHKQHWCHIQLPNFSSDDAVTKDTSIREPGDVAPPGAYQHSTHTTHITALIKLQRLHLHN